MARVLPYQNDNYDKQFNDYNGKEVGGQNPTVSLLTTTTTWRLRRLGFGFHLVAAGSLITGGWRWLGTIGWGRYRLEQRLARWAGTTGVGAVASAGTNWGWGGWLVWENNWGGGYGWK